MKKVIKIAIVIVPALIVVAVIVAYFLLSSIIRTSVETVGPKVTGTKVTLANVRLSPFSGAGAIKSLHIGNPEGYEADSAFELGEVKVVIEPKSLMSDTVIIREIVVDSPKITYERKLSGSNIRKIRENVDAFSASRGAGATTEPSQEETGKKLIIDRFAVRNAEVKLAVTALQGEGVTLPLGDLEIKDIGRQSDGATIEQVMFQIFPEIYEAITRTVANSPEALEQGLEMLEDSATKALGDAAEQGASSVLKGVKKILK